MKSRLLRNWFGLAIFVTFLLIFNVLYTGIAWRQLQERYTELSLYGAANFSASMKVISSILQLNRYLQNKTLFVDPRFISKMRGFETHSIGDNQLHIGEERLDDILETNTVMMAFFDQDRLDIVSIS
ncbi:unnamed protein product [Cercopithifilaria johnstoni]|uniref:Uncharacterized protein n=1 Tax=Cercopithifilaria johnstoni TaxID=2874296 RepID=A0A8J2Q4G4_9BILA|nr:unnamed protein product [Cercopithifilaria johnstoni]